MLASFIYKNAQEKKVVLCHNDRIDVGPRSHGGVRGEFGCSWTSWTPKVVELKSKKFEVSNSRIFELILSPDSRRSGSSCCILSPKSSRICSKRSRNCKRRSFSFAQKRSRKLKRILWEGKGLPASSRQDQTNNGGLIACSATKWNCSPATSLPSLRCLSDLQQSSTSESFLLRIRFGRPILGFPIFPSKAAVWGLIQRGK